MPKRSTAPALTLPGNLFVREDDADLHLDRSETESAYVFQFGEAFLGIVTDSEEGLLRVWARDADGLAETINRDFLANGWKIRAIGPDFRVPGLRFPRKKG